MCRATATAVLAKMLNEWLQVCVRQHLNQHTNIRVHLGSIHGMNELAKAFLVTVHLPVSTDKEFPGHVCGFEVVFFSWSWNGGANSPQGAQGWESGCNSAAPSIYKMGRFDNPSLSVSLVNGGTPVNASHHVRKRRINVMVRSRTARGRQRCCRGKNKYFRLNQHINDVDDDDDKKSFIQSDIFTLKYI